MFVCLFACDIQAKVDEARQALLEVTRCNTERLLSMKSLLDQKKELENKLNARQKKKVLSVHFIQNINQSLDPQCQLDMI